MIWTSNTPIANGFYWLRRVNQKDTIVKIYDIELGLNEFGASVSWTGSDNDSSLYELLVGNDCSWSSGIRDTTDIEKLKTLLESFDIGYKIKGKYGE